MLDDEMSLPFRVSDLKQWAYCPRILYYALCLPDVRPVTYRMQAGVEAGRLEKGREERRSLRAYGIEQGECEFDVPVRSMRWGLRGEVDLVITVAGSGEVIPVDYKLTRETAPHFELQLAAYGMLLEEERGVKVTRGFLYSIPQRRAEEIRLDTRLRRKTEQAIGSMRRMLEREEMPPPVRNRAKCVGCEFRRFCNDVV